MDVITTEGEVIPISPREWNGESPFFLVFEPDDGQGGNVGIDLDTGGWIEANRETFRRPGVWFLVSKQFGAAVMAILVSPGEQFYYHRHHVGNLMSSGEVTVQAIGKKRGDGSTVRLWMLPNGIVMAGEENEIDPVAARMIGG